MKGRLIFMGVDGQVSEAELAGPPTLDQLQQGVGGYIEIVPGWNQYQGAWAVMFCNENGKLDRLPPNARANALMSDYFLAHDRLVGDVVIVTGDAELMAEL
jgi:hypothetical protein